jgi:hypothetical protein
MAYTVPQIIDIATVSGYLAQSEVEKGVLFGQRKDPQLPMKIYMEKKAVEWAYDQDSDYEDIKATANYLFSLCGKYAILANYIVNNSTGGDYVSPITLGSSPYLIVVTSSQFSDATNYNNANLVGKTLSVFWNDIPRFLIPDVEYEVTATGINILVPGFDATSASYTFFIFITNGSTGTTFNITNTTITNGFYTGVGGEIYFDAVDLIDKELLELERESFSAFEIIYSGTPTMKQLKFESALGRVTFSADFPIAAAEQIVYLFQ